MDIAVFQHHNLEHLSILSDILEERNITYRYLKFHRNEEVPKQIDEIKGVKGVIVLGGPMSVYDTDKIDWLNAEIKLLNKLIAIDFPIFGICLGSQLIACAAGASVFPDRKKSEIGWYPIYLEKASETDPLHLKLPKSLHVFQWHGDTFDLPKNAKHLASSEHFKNQAFRIGKNIYAFQYHMEIKEEDIKNWIIEFSEDLESTRSDTSREKILKDTRQHIEETNSRGKKIFCDWLNLIQF